MVPGETVTIGGNFLIDSPMQLAGNPSLMDPSRAPTFAPGPSELPCNNLLMLTADAGFQFDRAYKAYFGIQPALVSDATPPPVELNTLVDGLARLEMLGDVHDEAQKQFGHARRAATRLNEPLEQARAAFRAVSHAMLRAAVVASGPITAEALTQYYCPMVPGNGRDWMQSGGGLVNPYWGAEMLHCGEAARDLAVKTDVPTIAEATKHEAL